MMGLQLVHKTEQSHAHDLELILNSTRSLLAYHRPHIRDGAALRILDLAILNAVAELEQLDGSPSDGATAVRHAPEGR
jgi:hypothetical protein